MKIDLRNLLLGAACVAALSSTAFAQDFDVPQGNLKAALDAYRSQAGVSLVVMSDALKGVSTRGVRGNLSPDAALSRILSGTGFVAKRDASGMIAVVPDDRRGDSAIVMPLQLAQASSPKAAVETVTVTSSKLGGGDVQSIPIAITALSQEQLTSTQTAGGPDLVKQVPNLTFSKTNFTGYNIEIRGIGTQAISVTTDPAVAVAFNDIPFIRNHFFEQEFYDVSQVEVLRGPQGTLYGRNATAGVVNVIPAKPTDQFEAMASGDIGNYKNRRFEGMINLPIVDDRVDVRLAGEWTKRDGYSFNEITNQPIDGRDLWSSRLSIAVKPLAELQATLVWEHFQEDDDRMRSAKQLCHRDPTPTEVGGVDVGSAGAIGSLGQVPLADMLSQGCRMGSLYTPDAFGVPNGFSLPFYQGLSFIGYVNGNIDPYLSTRQSTNLRNIQSALNPSYKAKNDVVELNLDYSMSPALTLTSQTGFNHDFLYSTEDYNRFNTSPGLFKPISNSVGYSNVVSTDGVFCDPQLGCADRMVAEDLSDEHAWQLSQEIRLSSNYSGPLNFSFGGNFLHYETEENYYVFINALTLIDTHTVFGNSVGPALRPWIPGVSDNSQCIVGPRGGYQYPDPTQGSDVLSCGYIDPNPVSLLNNEGHNYFLSQNPYVLNSYAGFGEVYYNVLSDLKLTGGLRWTDDQKHFVDIPSELLTYGYGYPSTATVDQTWKKWTGRFAANWTPKLDFTDQTLIYGSFAHGYKAGGANPPGAVLLTKGGGEASFPIHPLTFEPEFINAYELGTKNTLLDGALTVNGDVFYYDYKGYQISEIVDRTSINLNFDATVKGAELEAKWEPLPGLKFTFAGGYEATRAANGSKAIDLMDRSAGNPDWMVMKPFLTQSSNCVLPVYVVAALAMYGGQGANACGVAYYQGLDPVTNLPYAANPTQCGDTNHNPSPCNLGSYAGFDPVDPNAANNGAGPAPNKGEGFYKDLSGNELPNAPHFTTAISAEYSLPVTAKWAATLHGDFYWQASSWARIINDDPYDRIHGYKNVNLALIFTSQDGWQVMGYLKNVFNTTAITGDFLNSDDSGLTTNIFLTDPRLFGVRVTKNF